VQEGVNEALVQALANFADSPAFTRREKLALRFAERMALQHQQIDNAFFADLRREFSDAEIIELGLLTGLFIGYGRLIAVLDLESPSAPPTEETFSTKTPLSR
jgi:alkylhydroperoxidase family enzyme